MMAARSAAASTACGRDGVLGYGTQRDDDPDDGDDRPGRQQRSYAQQRPQKCPPRLLWPPTSGEYTKHRGVGGSGRAPGAWAERERALTFFPLLMIAVQDPKGVRVIGGCPVQRLRRGCDRRGILREISDLHAAPEPDSADDRKGHDDPDEDHDPRLQRARGASGQTVEEEGRSQADERACEEGEDAGDDDVPHRQRSTADRREGHSPRQTDRVNSGQVHDPGDPAGQEDEPDHSDRRDDPWIRGHGIPLCRLPVHYGRGTRRAGCFLPVLRSVMTGESHPASPLAAQPRRPHPPRIGWTYD